MAKKKVEEQKVEVTEPGLTKFEREYIFVAHQTKYNIYILAKSLVLASLVEANAKKLLNGNSLSELVQKTNELMEELDLEAKARKELVESSTRKTPEE